MRLPYHRERKVDAGNVVPYLALVQYPVGVDPAVLQPPDHGRPVPDAGAEIDQHPRGEQDV